MIALKDSYREVIYWSALALRGHPRMTSTLLLPLLLPMWTHVDKGRGGQKPDFFVDVINGWPLIRVISKARAQRKVTYSAFIKGSLIKDVRKKWPLFITPPPFPQVSAFDQPHLPPLCGRPHLASYTALWSDSVIAGAIKIRCSLISSRHFTPTPCGLICGSCN